MIAALFVEANGCYSGLDGVDLWDIERDARLYEGPWPVVAHPPCARWSVLAGLVESKHGLMRGDDGGCFESALESVRRFGGVLEHPAGTAAWAAFGIPKPSRFGTWGECLDGGWTCQVEQGRYGHQATKATWLYAFGVEPPSLRWGCGLRSGVVVGRKKGYRAKEDFRKEMPKSQRIATPPEFRDVLISIAESAAPWFLCRCGDYFCRRHNVHAYECDCPPVEEWSTSPYASEVQS